MFHFPIPRARKAVQTADHDGAVNCSYRNTGYNYQKHSIIKPEVNMNKLTEGERAYLAGFFDGEGCVSLTRQRGRYSISPSYNLRVLIGQAGEKGYKFLDYWKTKTGIGNIFEKMKNSDREQVGYNWITCSNDALDLLIAISPYLSLKLDEANLAIQFQSTKKSKTYNDSDNVRGYGGRGRLGGLDKELIEEREAIYRQLSEMKGAISRRGRKPKLDLFS